MHLNHVGTGLTQKLTHSAAGEWIVDPMEKGGRLTARRSKNLAAGRIPAEDVMAVLAEKKFDPANHDFLAAGGGIFVVDQRDSHSPESGSEAQ